MYGVYDLSLLFILLNQNSPSGCFLRLKWIKRKEIKHGYSAQAFRMAFLLLTSWEGEWDSRETERFQGVSVSRVTKQDCKFRASSGIVGRRGGCVSQSSCAIQTSHPEFTHKRTEHHTHSQRIDLVTPPFFYFVVLDLIDLQEYCNQKRVITDNVLSSLHCVIRMDALLNLIFKKKSYFLCLPHGLV